MEIRTGRVPVRHLAPLVSRRIRSALECLHEFAVKREPIRYTKYEISHWARFWRSIAVATDALLYPNKYRWEKSDDCGTTT